MAQQTNKPTIDYLANGMALIVDEVPHVISVSYELIIPGGLISDPLGKVGLSLALPEYLMRGAGNLSAEMLSNAFDEEGIVHSESSGSDKYYFRGSLLPEQLSRAFELLALILTEPQFDSKDLPAIQNLLLMEIESLKDNPSSQALTEMQERYFPTPYNRRSVGYAEDIASLTAEDCAKAWSNAVKAKGAILSVSGNIKRQEVIYLSQKFFGKISGDCIKAAEITSFPQHKKHHVQKDSAQMQIVLCYPAPLFQDSCYYSAKVANSIMSNSMYGRLFIEVREKRGLVYAVYARYSASKKYGIVTAYAGTTTERAEETLSVMSAVLANGKGTITDVELKRAKIGMKSSIALGEESTSSRASSNANDYWLSGTVRGVTEIYSRIEAVTASDIDLYFSEYPLNSYMQLTLGAKAI